MPAQGLRVPGPKLILQQAELIVFSCRVGDKTSEDDLSEEKEEKRSVIS